MMKKQEKCEIDGGGAICQRFLMQKDFNRWDVPHIRDEAGFDGQMMMALMVKSICQFWYHRTFKACKRTPKST